MTSRSLLALTASALALPGVPAPARADTPPTNTTVAYRFSNYAEDDLRGRNLRFGSPDRYDIDIHQFQLVTPIGENYSLGLVSSYESMSGASPWYNIPPTAGEDAVVMSGATIAEQRRDLNLSARRYLDNGTVGVNIGASSEDDYDSISGGVDAERHFNNDLTTIAAGVNFSSDDIFPTDARLFNRVREESKTTRSVFVSVSQVIDRYSLFQSSLNVTRHEGYLTDPYKLNDARPDSRTQLAWSNAYRRFLPELEAALHLDLRLYDDDFGITSVTFDAAWYQTLSDVWQVVPSIRYYSQSEADFFRPVNGFLRPGELQSSDYRLANYGALSGGVKVQAEIEDVTVSLILERYVTNAHYSLFDGPTSPALVNFTRMTLGLSYLF